MTPIDGSRAPILPGPALVARIGALSHPPRVARVKWRWMLDWWDRYRAHGRRPRRRGIPIS